jgi:AraC-like DNA-binding protein
LLFDFNLHSSLLLPFAVQGAVASIILWVRGRREGALADCLLSVLLFLLTLSVMQWLLGYAGWYDARDAHSTLMFYVPWSNTLAYGPLLYAYFRALTDHQFTLRGEWRHFLPAIVFAGLYAVAFAIDWGYLHAWLGRPMPEFYGTKGLVVTALDSVGIGFQILEYASLFYYGTRTLRAFQAYQQYLDANFSDTARLRFGWVKRLLLATLAALTVWVGLSLASRAGVELGFDGWWYAYFATGLLIYYLSFAGLQAGSAGRPALLFQPDAPVVDSAEAQRLTPGPTKPLVSPHALEAEAPANSTALPLELTEWLPRLLALMETDAPWREPELTLADLAHRMRLAPALLSKVINAGTGQNFNDFVNTYRVAEAARRLRDPAFKHYTLLAVALEAGFNSKSTFNRVFKKLNGLTPSEFAALDPSGAGTIL